MWLISVSQPIVFLRRFISMGAKILNPSFIEQSLKALGQVRKCMLIQPKIIQKIFETNHSFHMKQCSAGKN